MQPWELLERLKGLQTAANNVTITSAAVSRTVGDYTECLGDACSREELYLRAENMRKCIVANQDALEKYCDAAALLAGG